MLPDHGWRRSYTDICNELLREPEQKLVSSTINLTMRIIHMNSALPPVHLSAVDEEVFRIRTARAPEVTLDTLPNVLNFCRTNAVTLLIARCSAFELQVAQAMEREGFALMDTLVQYTRDLARTPIPSDTGDVTVRPIRPGEEEQVKDVATKAFRGYFGHYRADGRLDPAKCDEVYSSWAFRSCLSRDVADEVLVADLDNCVVGFASLRVSCPEEGQGVLSGVAPPFQRRGIKRSMMIHQMEWCLSKGAKRMVVSTQITNIAIQKVWTRVRFEPSHAYYTFHKWFDRPCSSTSRQQTAP